MTFNKTPITALPSIRMKIKLNLSLRAIGLLFMVFALLQSVTEPIVSHAQDTAPAEEIRLNWSFGAWVQTNSGHELISVDKDMTLRSGDRLKFFLEPLNDCHIYLIYHGSQDEMHLLFPTGKYTSLQDQDLQVPYLIPKGSGWFSIDSNPGLERFYLLASPDPLHTLEKLLAQIEGSTATDRQSLAQEIRAEIKRLKRSHRQLSAAAERPAAIGGTVRGTIPEDSGANPDVRQLAREISASSFYSRTFTIEHE